MITDSWQLTQDLLQNITARPHKATSVQKLRKATCNIITPIKTQVAYPLPKGPAQGAPGNGPSIYDRINVPEIYSLHTNLQKYAMRTTRVKMKTTRFLSNH